MPNIAAVLREEISRLSRKETRSQTDPVKKAAAQHRRDIALLKRQVAQLERQVKVLARKTSGTTGTAASETEAKRVRFVAKGLRSQRKRLDLSAGGFGQLIGVSAQSIYNWERGSAYPRAQQLARIAALRGIGKREAHARLKAVAAAKKKPRKV
jgi:DNA-binding transcriptional regulator YiaG